MAKTIRLLNNDRRREAEALCRSAPYGTEVVFRERRRTLSQNDRLHPKLRDISRQLEWHGQRLTPDQWKLVFLSGLHRDAGVVPDFSGTGVIPLKLSSSALRVSEFSELLELIEAYGKTHGVKWSESSGK